MDVTIVIVSYNTKDLLKRCLASIYKHIKSITVEVIVVDNASTDGTVSLVQKEFPKTIVIANKHNNFFAKANNQAFLKAKGKYILILNADTYFVDNAVGKMISYMEKHPKAGACEGLELYENGDVVPTGSQFSTPLIDFYELSLFGKWIKNKATIDAYRYAGKDRRKDFAIDVGCDAFLMVRKEILDSIAGYDETFFLYYTENDLCLRIKEKGYGVMHMGSAKVIHTVSASVAKIGWKKAELYYHDLRCYYQKHGYYFFGFLLFILLKSESFLLQIREKVR